MAIHEVMPLLPEMKKLIMQHASDQEIFALAKKQGTSTIREDGISKVLAGKTTLEELVRVAFSEG